MKSVLVMDTPDKCENCPVSYSGTDANGDNYMGCQKMMQIRPVGEDKPEWCPLIPLPQKEIANEYDFENYKNGVAIGWNRCLEKITSEGR